MGLRARLDAMESHATAQQWKRQRSNLSRSGLVSLCPADSISTHVPDGCLGTLEDNFNKQKEGLTWLASSSILHRSTMTAKLAPKNLRFVLDQASTFDPLGLGSHRHIGFPSSSDREGCHSHAFQFRNDCNCPTNSSGLQQQASPPADVLPSLKNFSAAATLVDMHASKPAEVISSPKDFTAAAALVDMQASIPEQHVDAEAANACIVSCESSTHPGAFNAIISSREQQLHKGIMPAARKTIGCLASAAGEVPNREPLYKQLLERARASDVRCKELTSEIEIKEALWENLRRTKQALFERRKRDTLQLPIPEAFSSPAFTPLTKEEEGEVHEALNGANRRQLLVQHEPSNIDLSREALQCLKPGAWLNDEVINLYMELLKERECREQKVYLKCHFFNTFFFNKLYKDAHSYDYKAVRRWTTQKKLGYSLLECDKIFVPIHKDIHWCLAVINLREKKFQYLDSLKGQDLDALEALARYIKDEAKDKGAAEAVDTSGWKRDCPKNIPEQKNGCDCGMFMIKYADFLSRGDELKFTQEDMPYFRKRTVLELLQLKAR